jgi:hypothetical protein
MEEADGFQYFRLKNKVIYYVPISIGDAPSASKAGIAEQIDVAADDILRWVAAEDEASS